MSLVNDWALSVLLSRFARVAIVGGPGVGKSTLASGVVDRPLVHGDDWKAESWSDQPLRICAACGAAGERFVVEGAQVARALRKGLQVDAVLVLDRPKRELTPGQASLAKGVGTVLSEWRAANPAVPVVGESEAAAYVVGSLLG